MLSLLHTYITVYKLRSFSKAAAVLYISQPTVSVHIKKLEQLTETPLFLRNDDKSITPTEFGDILYPQAQNIIKNWDNTIIDLDKKKRSRKSITLLLSHSISELYFKNFIPKLILNFPHIDFTFLVKHSTEIMQLVTEDSSVIGLIEEPTNRIDFYEVKLFEDGLIHVGNPTSPYWITREWDYSLHELSQVYWNLHHLKFNEIATNNLSFLFKLVANDIGQTLTSKKALDSLPKIQWQETSLARDFTLISKKNPLKNTNSALLITFLIEEFKNNTHIEENNSRLNKS